MVQVCSGRQKDEKNHIIRFKHNRFNLVFLLGQAVYFHHEDISHFLGAVHGTDNDLLKVVLLDSQETLYIAGGKALGLISKFISAPPPVLNAVSATWAKQRRPILVAFYDTHGDTEDTFST